MATPEVTRLLMEYVKVVWPMVGATVGATGFEVVLRVEKVDGCFAEVEVLRNRKVLLRVAPKALKAGPEKLRNTIIHEGLHVSLDRMTALVEHALEVGEQDFAIDILREAEEQVVERLTAAVESRVPLPPAKLRALLSARRRAPRK